MLKVIGNINCSRCNVVKKLLDKNGIKYEYFYLNQLSKDVQEEYLKQAKVIEVTSLPLFIIKNKVVNKSVQEVISQCK